MLSLFLYYIFVFIFYSRYQRAFYQLKFVIECEQGSHPNFSPFTLADYGCYCGVGGQGAPVDGTDWQVTSRPSCCCCLHLFFDNIFPMFSSVVSFLLTVFLASRNSRLSSFCDSCRFVTCTTPACVGFSRM